MSLRPGDIVMHPKQYNRVCELMRVVKSKDGAVTTWNGVRVIIDENMPPAGWFIVPGMPE